MSLLEVYFYVLVALSPILGIYVIVGLGIIWKMIQDKINQDT